MRAQNNKQCDAKYNDISTVADYYLDDVFIPGRRLSVVVI